jgi:hypothetical protein
MDAYVPRKSEQSRVYLCMKPEESKCITSSENLKPHELWKYLHIESGAEFVFVDRSGFGDYVLVHSTKRGELRDDTWQRYLQ